MADDGGCMGGGRTGGTGGGYPADADGNVYDDLRGWWWHFRRSETAASDRACTGK